MIEMSNWSNVSASSRKPRNRTMRFISHVKFDGDERSIEFFNFDKSKSIQLKFADKETLCEFSESLRENVEVVS